MNNYCSGSKTVTGFSTIFQTSRIQEHYLIFCGYAFNDFHIRTILFDLTHPKINRPQYALVDPTLAEVESRYWNKNTSKSA